MKLISIVFTVFLFHVLIVHLKPFKKGSSIRTENNKSPHQLFVQGYLLLQRSNLVALDFAEQVDTNYGIDEQGLATTLESQVEVPKQSLLTFPESALGTAPSASQSSTFQ